MINFNRIVVYRMIASFIDDLTLLLTYIILRIMFNNNNSEIISIFLLFTSFIIIEIYFFKKSTSLGKFFMGLEVINKNSSSKISLKNMLIRELLGKIISNILFIGYIYILFNNNNQGFHDKLVGSIVIENN